MTNMQTPDNLGNAGAFGFLAIAKPQGITSHDVVSQLRRVTGMRQIGHTGTLDPLATGLLVICVGKATRLASFIESQEKEYVTTIRLGATSNTYDATGTITPTPDAIDHMPDEQQIRATLTRFIGTIQQIPPAFSAIKINGERAYSLARAGATPLMTPRTVTIHNIELLAYEWPFLQLRIVCSKGTYIRSLAHDIGAALGGSGKKSGDTINAIGGLMEKLERTRVGDIRLADATPLAMLKPRTWTYALIPAEKLLANYPIIIIPDKQLTDVLHGKEIPYTSLASHTNNTSNRTDKQLTSSDSTRCLLFSETRQCIALATIDPTKKTLHPERVFMN